MKHQNFTERNRVKIVNISNDPRKYRELFKKYPLSYVTADVEYKKPPEVLNIDDIYLDEIDSATGERRLMNPFDPLFDDERELANKRRLNRSDGDMENPDFPEFNMNLPRFNEKDPGIMSELKSLNRALIDKMYAAYHEDADELLRQGDLKSIGTKDNLLNKIEVSRQQQLIDAKNKYSILADVFGVIEESDEEDREDQIRKRKNDRKGQNGNSGVHQTYYRDIAKVKERRELIMAKRKRPKSTSLDNKTTKSERFYHKGVYALNQLSPLKKQDIYKEEQNELKKKKPKSRHIDRSQIPVDPLVQENSLKISPSKSSEVIEEEHVKFQSAEKSLGTSTKVELFKGITSLQEQPNKFANFDKKKENPPQREIKKQTIELIKNEFKNNDFGISKLTNLDGETTESVPLSTSERDNDEYKKATKTTFGMFKIIYAV
jgi:hypothetical protein